LFGREFGSFLFGFFEQFLSQTLLATLRLTNRATWNPGILEAVLTGYVNLWIECAGAEGV
jgi:hypothetical protein